MAGVEQSTWNVTNRDAGTDRECVIGWLVSSGLYKNINTGYDVIDWKKFQTITGAVVLGTDGTLWSWDRRWGRTEELGSFSQTDIYCLDGEGAWSSVRRKWLVGKSGEPFAGIAGDLKRVIALHT